MSELIPLSFQKIIQSRSYTAVVLGTASQTFSIYTEPHVGRTIQMYLASGKTERPSTHELISSMLKGFDAKIVQVVISRVEGTTYFARLFVQQQCDPNSDLKEILDIDARPSDCLILALIHKIPLFCSHEVLEKSGLAGASRQE